MPTVIKPDALTKGSGKSRDRVATSPLELLQYVSFGHYAYLVDHEATILHSDFSSPNGDIRSIVPNKNGFTHTVIRAWQQDLHLKIRPDDVWLAILTQLSFFVNGNAEALRSVFVAHEDRPKLVANVEPITGKTVDVDTVVPALVDMVKQRLKDPNIATTLLPKFTTTTPRDQTTAAIVFLGAMKEYFSYRVAVGCSFPSVTLLGERSDWADILRRVAWFGTIDHEDSIAWSLRLTKILEYMVASFDRPNDPDIKQFWMRTVHECGAGYSGGIVTLSGWLTAFCWWGADGKRAKNYSDQELGEYLSLRQGKGWQRLTLDGVEFPVVRQNEIPTGVVRVPITLGEEGRDPVKADLLAGSMGMQVIAEEDETAVQPASGWWLFEFTPRKNTPQAPSTANDG